MSNFQSVEKLKEMGTRWDKEWISYFRRAPDYFQDYSFPNNEIQKRIKAVETAIENDLNLKNQGIVHKDNPIWTIWGIAAYPSEIRNKQIADLGCGPGGIGRTLGYVAKHYLGLDYSPLALRVGELVSPDTCTYLVRHKVEEIEKYFSTRDIVFSRSVFIHQNFDQAVELATLGGNLLKSGGVLVADFFLPNKDMYDPEQRGISRFAKQDLDTDRPTVGFYFTHEELHEVAKACSLKLESITANSEKQWNIVRFRKP